MKTGFVPAMVSRLGREGLVFGAILLLATALRVAWPTLAEFKFDEARMATLAWEMARQGRIPLAGLPSSLGFEHSPVSVYLYAPVFLLSSSPVVATVYSGLLGAAGVALAWWLARRWAGSGLWGPRVAGLLLATSPWFVVFTRKIWQIAFVPVLALVFLGFVVSALVQGRRWNLAWALVAFALLVQVHPSAVSLGVALLLWLVLFRRQVQFGPLVLGTLLGVFTAAPYLVHQVREGWPAWSAVRALPPSVVDLEAVRLAAAAISGGGIHSLAGEALPQLRVVPLLAHGFSGVLWLVAGGLVVLCVRGWRNHRASTREQRRAAGVDVILLSCLAFPILFNLRHSAELHLHSFALLVPAACLVAGRGIDALCTSGNLRTPLLRAARAVALVLAGCIAALQVVALVLTAQFVADHDTPGGFGRPLRDYLLLAGRAADAVQAGQAGEVLVVAAGDTPWTDEMPAILSAVLRGRVPYRLVDARTTALFPAHPSVALIAPGAGQNAALYDPWPAEELPGGFRLADLDGSWPTAGLAEIAGIRTFENGVELQGYRWQDDGEQGEVHLWLLWQVLWRSPHDTHFSVHLIDGDGRRIGQGDAAGFATPYRRPGDRVISQFRVGIAGKVPPGPLQARVGAYLYPQVVNLSVLDGTGNAVADAVMLSLVGE